MKALDTVKTQGRIILLFPSGTRYRPGDPSTKKGVREIDSYIHSFDYMCCVALNGMILHVQQSDMMNDKVGSDIVRVTAGPIYSCAEFRKKARSQADAAGVEDKKQAVVDAIMAELERLHNETEDKRKKLLEVKT
jgi:glycerol-3-phosphate O-acyltransferase